MEMEQGSSITAHGVLQIDNTTLAMHVLLLLVLSFQLHVLYLFKN